MKENLLILGAKSDIAMAVAYRFAQEGFDIQLAARNVKTLDTTQSDIQIRHEVAVTLNEFDVLDVENHHQFIASLETLPTIVMCAIGMMENQDNCDQSMKTTVLMIRSNFEGPAVVLHCFAQAFQKRGHGTLIGISSCAGERGRASNYTYGSSKAGLTAFLSGLRNKYFQDGLLVITVIPGFVHTKMTERLNLPTMLTVNANTVANVIYRAYEKKRDVIYIGWYWHMIMMIIKLIPEKFFKRSRL